MAKQTEYNVGIYLRLSKEDMLEGESLSIDGGGTLWLPGKG